ncbi:MAG: hypothetical protein D3903_08570, partial [Candidatus Electrothrix sp. GM3_4]|nr:hypothetical protein [Candidatus Electrothrix sp. GM3_4]
GGATVFVVISVAGKFHNDHSKHIVFRTCYKIFDRDVNVRSVGKNKGFQHFFKNVVGAGWIVMPKKN